MLNSTRAMIRFTICIIKTWWQTLPDVCYDSEDISWIVNMKAYIGEDANSRARVAKMKIDNLI